MKGQEQAMPVPSCTLCYVLYSAIKMCRLVIGSLSWTPCLKILKWSSRSGRSNFRVSFHLSRNERSLNAAPDSVQHQHLSEMQAAGCWWEAALVCWGICWEIWNNRSQFCVGPAFVSLGDCQCPCALSKQSSLDTGLKREKCLNCRTAAAAVLSSPSEVTWFHQNEKHLKPWGPQVHC